MHSVSAQFILVSINKTKNKYTTVTFHTCEPEHCIEMQQWETPSSLMCIKIKVIYMIQMQLRSVLFVAQAP